MRSLAEVPGGSVVPAEPGRDREHAVPDENRAQLTGMKLRKAEYGVHWVMFEKKPRVSSN